MAELIDINSFPEEQVYMLYDLYKRLEQDKEQIAEPTDEDSNELGAIKSQLAIIEIWAGEKQKVRQPWSKQNLLLTYGPKPTVIIEFYPGSATCKKFGRQIVANLEFSNEELRQIVEDIQNKVAEENAIVNISIVNSDIKGTVNTFDFFELAGRRV